eukprot:gene1001-3014_t
MVPDRHFESCRDGALWLGAFDGWFGGANDTAWNIVFPPEMLTYSVEHIRGQIWFGINTEVHRSREGAMVVKDIVDSAGHPAVQARNNRRATVANLRQSFESLKHGLQLGDVCTGGARLTAAAHVLTFRCGSTTFYAAIQSLRMKPRKGMHVRASSINASPTHEPQPPQTLHAQAGTFRCEEYVRDAPMTLTRPTGQPTP